jgi:hypothetical protein
VDRVLSLNQEHLRRVMVEYVDYYNRRQPHQGIEQRCPTSLAGARQEGAIERYHVLGGIIHDYQREAAGPAMQGWTGISHPTGHFRLRRHNRPAREYRAERTQRFQTWLEMTGAQMAA